MLFETFSSNMTMLENAIRNKLVCTIYYRGETKGIVDDGYRTIEPYALGVNFAGNTVLRAWLVKGTSKSGKRDPSLVPGWRLFRVDRMKSVATSLATFKTPRKGYNSQDEGMKEVTISADF